MWDRKSMYNAGQRDCIEIVLHADGDAEVICHWCFPVSMTAEDAAAAFKDAWERKVSPCQDGLIKAAECNLFNPSWAELLKEKEAALSAVKE